VGDRGRKRECVRLREREIERGHRERERGRKGREVMGDIQGEKGRGYNE
jgi:hypothetical protein